MAEEGRDPPPMERADLFAEDDDDDDIFKSTTSQPRMEASVPAEEVVDLNDGDDKQPPAEDDSTSHELNPFAASVPDKKLEPNHKDSDTTTTAPAVVDLSTPPAGDAQMSANSSTEDDGDDLFASPQEDLPVKKETVPDVKPKYDINPPIASSKKTEEEAEEQDQFNIEITITNPMKIGDGMNAYMVYQVNTVTNIPAFRESQFAVKRRFSDFLGLHDKLVVRHQNKGIIVPKPPEKSTVGMAKVKMSKEESGQLDFVEKRRAALERFMNHTVAHPELRMDPDLRDFVTLDADLPKASSTSALSAAGVLRLFGKVGEAVTRLSTTIPDDDSWYDEKLLLIENLEINLRKLHDNAEILVMRRHAASQNATALAKAVALLASMDDHINLKQALCKLADVQENVQQIYEEQADSDFFTLSELFKDYLGLVTSVKDVFAERMKTYKHWKDAATTLTKKREAKVKLELANKTDKLPGAEEECREWERKVDKGEEDFKKISEALKKEMGRFDKKRCKDFKANLVNYLEKLLNNEEQLIKHWEGFLPTAKSVA